ncbi:hydrogenase [Spirochaetia bacterium]|nr:hydrogenase [Spirochaetia bacterium]
MNNMRKETKKKPPVYNTAGNCRDCYKCIRHCPAKAIKDEQLGIYVVEERCVACGMCVTKCPGKFIVARNDIDHVKRLLAQKEKVFVSLSPLIFAEWSGIEKELMALALKKLGFYAVSEITFGTQLMAQAINKMVHDALPHGQKLFIPPVCPSVVKYIMLYESRLTPFIMDVASPLIAHARMLKKLYGRDIHIVHIGSCVGRKLEVAQFSEIDAVITFRELKRWFAREDIKLQPEAGHAPALIGEENLFLPAHASVNLSYFTEDDGSFAAYKNFPQEPDVVYMAHSGCNNIKTLLHGFDPDSLTQPLFLNLLACSGGCIGGPGMSAQKQNAFQTSGIGRRLNLFNHYQNSIKQKTDAPAGQELSDVEIKMTGTVRFTHIKKRLHTEDEMLLGLSSIGKNTKEDELNCGCCGYDTCRDFVDAMLEKHANTNMCAAHIRNLSEKQTNGLLQAIPSGVVVVDKRLKIIDCNKSFAKFFGSEIVELFDLSPGLSGAMLDMITSAHVYFSDFLYSGDSEHEEYEFRENNKIYHLNLFTIEKGNIIAGVFDDITKPQIQKNRTIAKAKNIIDKNVSVVQKIAFLLGEHAAETESILQSMIEAFDVSEE